MAVLVKLMDSDLHEQKKPRNIYLKFATVAILFSVKFIARDKT